MSAIVVSPEQQSPAILVQGWALVVLALTVMYLVTFEVGPVSSVLGQGATFLHEAFHDGRHLLGVPCH